MRALTRSSNGSKPPTCFLASRAGAAAMDGALLRLAGGRRCGAEILAASLFCAGLCIGNPSRRRVCQVSYRHPLSIHIETPTTKGHAGVQQNDRTLADG